MKRDPEVATRQSDVEKLYEIRDHVKHEMKLNGDVVENDAFKYAFILFLDQNVFSRLTFIRPVVFTLLHNSLVWCLVS